MLDLQRRAGNAAVAATLQRATETPSETLYVGFNPTAAAKEARPLKRLLGKNLTVAVDDERLESRLATNADAAAWILRNLPRAWRDLGHAVELLEFLVSFSPTTRDLVAPVIVTFDRAERGVLDLERLILSGHSNGVALWGDKTSDGRMGGRFLLDRDLKRLAKVFPKAAAQVSDVLFSACFSGVSVNFVRDAFPNVRTIWAYEGFSPKAGKGSMRHIRRWEAATRGDVDLTARSGLGSSTLWNSAGGPGGTFVRNDPARVDTAKIRGAVDAKHPQMQRYFTGDEPIDRGWLAVYYSLLQIGIFHPHVDAADKADYERQRDIVLRLRFWNEICVEFARLHRATIHAGYKAAAMTVPDFTALTRGDLDVDLAVFRGEPGNPPMAALAAVYGPLWRLTDTRAIPETWIG